MVRDKEYSYRVRMYGREIIKLNRIISDNFELVKEQLSKYYKVIATSENKQGRLRAISKNKVDEHHIPYNDFIYEVLEKPLLDKKFNLEEDIEDSLAKWTVNLLREAGEYDESN